jgi:hypothetical protein
MKGSKCRFTCLLNNKHVEDDVFLSNLIIIFFKNFYNKFKFFQLKLTHNSISRQVTTPRKHNDMQSGGNEKNQEQQIKKENEI